MNAYNLIAIILTIAVLIAYLNHKLIHMQTTIAITTASLLLSMLLLIAHHFGWVYYSDQARHLVQNLDFKEILLNGMLSFLLFAGSMTVDFDSLKRNKWEIGTLASLSTIASAILIGFLIFFSLRLLNINLNLIECFLFGALISPTDPIAVLATFKDLGAPKNLTTCVAGESLFNDGVGIVIFVTIFQLAFTGHAVTWHDVILLFCRQALGGIAYGIVLGLITAQLFKNLRDHHLMILITLAVVTGGYALALSWNISGPLAMVVAGIFVGNKSQHGAFHKQSQQSLHIFWEVIDEVLNAVLFLLIGFELLNMNFDSTHLIAAAIAIPLVLLIRLITVSIPMRFFTHWRNHAPLTITILTWGGLRGGLAVALALSLPDTASRSLILTMTYAVVAFAVIIQGLTIKPLVKIAKKGDQESTNA